MEKLLIGNHGTLQRGARRQDNMNVWRQAWQSPAPDAKLFGKFLNYLGVRGFCMNAGQMVDVTFVEVPINIINFCANKKIMSTLHFTKKNWRRWLICWKQLLILIFFRYLSLVATWRNKCFRYMRGNRVWSGIDFPPFEWYVRKGNIANPARRQEFFTGWRTTV